jgi:hypothetical protein
VIFDYRTNQLEISSPAVKISSSAGKISSCESWIRINLSFWIRIRIQIADPDPGGQKLPQKIEKRTEFSSFEVLDVLF